MAPLLSRLHFDPEPDIAVVQQLHVYGSLPSGAGRCRNKLFWKRNVLMSLLSIFDCKNRLIVLL